MVLISGCLGTVQYWTLPPSESQAVDQLENATATAQTAPGYAYSIYGSTEARRGAKSTSVDLTGAGTVDLSHHRAHIVLEYGDDHRERYVQEYRVYSYCWPTTYVDAEDTWYATELDRTRGWGSYLPVGSVGRLLEGSKVYVRGTAQVNDEAAEKFVVRPNPRNFRSLERQMMPSLSDDAEGQGTIQNVTITVWVSTNTDRPVQIRVYRRMRKGLFGATVEQRLTYTLTYVPTTINLPNRTVSSEEACPDP